jgi:hypothetical protein
MLMLILSIPSVRGQQYSIYLGYIVYIVCEMALPQIYTIFMLMV